MRREGRGTRQTDEDAGFQACMALEDIMVSRNGQAHLRREMPQETSTACKPVGTLFIKHGE